MINLLSGWILPLTVTFTVLFGLIKRVKVFDSFKEGALKGLQTVYGIFPTIVALVVAVTMLRESGAMDILSSAFSGFADFFGIPEQIIPVAMLTPVSGGGSLSVFQGVLEQYGPDSFIGQVASVLMGATDTTFYAVSIYYAAVGIKHTRHTLLAGLTADFASLVLSSYFVRLML